MTQQARLSCDAEPIHTPGHIQHHGVLFTLDAYGTIVCVSDNCAAFFGAAAAEIFGRHITQILAPDPNATQLDAGCFAKMPQAQEAAEEWGRVVPTLRQKIVLEAVSHRNSQNVWVVECELAHTPQLRQQPLERQFNRQIQRAQQRLYDAASTQNLVDAAVAQMFDCLGFDRVMAYQFDALWNGMVISEKKQPDLDSYLHQKFPASDIPSQARLTFTRNWLRSIPDVLCAPSMLLGDPSGQAQPPLDMMLCHLRAPSPTHLEYLRNMGVRATVTVSLISEGKLWGLIACHHMTPLQLCYEKRQAAEMVGRTTSALLASKQTSDNADYRRQCQAVQTKLFAAMCKEEGLVRGLFRPSPNVLDIVSATHTSAAFFFESRWSFLGAVPPVTELNQLVRWLAHEKAGLEIWQTESIAADYPVSETFCEVASGVLAINIPKNDDSYLLWFRPEVTRVIDWAGRPEKNLVIDVDGAHLHPRKSFERWQEVVKNRSLPWQAVEVEAALVLRKNIIEIDLNRQFRREQRALANTLAQKQPFEFLAHVTAVLARSLNYEVTLREFASILSQSFCDWVSVYVQAEGGLQRLVVCHATQQGNAVAQDLWRFAPIFAQLPEQTRSVVAQHESLLVPRIDGWLQCKTATGYLEFLTGRLGFESLLLLPIVARGKLLGVLKCVRSNRVRPFTQDDLRLGTQLTERAASCIDNALLYRGAQQAIQARDRVMGVVSHDLRNPLGAIRLTAERITRRYEKPDAQSLPAVVSSGLGKIQAACRRMDGLIEDVLSLSKIEAGHFTVDLKAVDVAAVMNEALDFLEPLADAKNISLSVTKPPGDVQVLCDADRIMQVFSNLVGNAIKFTPAGGSIDLWSLPHDDNVLFSVKDTGPGICSTHLPHVFDRFWQAAETSRHGAGLGLAIAKGIVEAHGGTIDVESVEGEGTCFSFSLRGAW